MDSSMFASHVILNILLIWCFVTAFTTFELFSCQFMGNQDSGHLKIHHITKWTRKSNSEIGLNIVARSSLAPFGLFLGGHRKVATRSKGPFELKRNWRKQLGAYEWAESTVTLLHLILLCICYALVCLMALPMCDICGIVHVPGTLSWYLLYANVLYIGVVMCLIHCVMCLDQVQTIWAASDSCVHAGWNLCLQWMHNRVSPMKVGHVWKSVLSQDVWNSE